ncbi:Eco57I restriction-modification methylase domain-containing protein [Alteromonas macleodii]|uniref:Eco57I restriction-modification methylase domain-containing protein n=1 Tax=Alteromonas macleodii TaxID=28108 RepID=UPI00313B8424
MILEEVRKIMLPLLKSAETRRVQATPLLDQSKRGKLGQYMTPEEVARLLPTFFSNADDQVRLLDAGAGVGSLTAAFIDQLNESNEVFSIDILACEIDTLLRQYLIETIADCREWCESSEIQFTSNVVSESFIEYAIKRIHSNSRVKDPVLFNRIILNPPYSKVGAKSKERLLCQKVGVDSGNLYSLFVGLALKLLAPKGELVAITPRSFCNGPYFRAFREQIFTEAHLEKLHVFESRTQSFKGDDVLQENIIFKLTKNSQDVVEISKSHSADSEDITLITLPKDDVIYPNDPNKFVHIITSTEEKRIAKQIGQLPNSLSDLGIDASTGRVVDFRATEFTSSNPKTGYVPLIYPSHLKNGSVNWPLEGFKRPNAILDSEKSKKLLVPNGVYVVTRRMSSKEEPRRVVASIYDGRLFDFENVGFENKTNFFHSNFKPLKTELAFGIYAFISSDLVDAYFRMFNGHTQVNATDLRFLRYPSSDKLFELGSKVIRLKKRDMMEIDRLVRDVISNP